MNESIRASENEIAHTAAIVEIELHDGFLRDVAAAKVDTILDGASALEIASIILPEPAPKPGSGVVLEPRWTFVAGSEAADAVKIANTTNSSSIINVATSLNMRRLLGDERLAEDVESIDPERAVFVVEGGGNKTSVVRRGVALKALHELYGEDLSGKTLYQFGSGREIDLTKNDVPNPENKIIRDLAGEFLPEDTFTEFEANLATALAEGYEVSSEKSPREDGLVSRRYNLKHSDKTYPKLVLIQPTGPRLEEALDCIKPLLESEQLVIATNGQYRAKDAYQAELWADDRGVEMLPVVTLGDEPGDTFQFGNKEPIVVPSRPESAYINDFVVLWRLALKRLPDVEIESQE